MITKWNAKILIVSITTTIVSLFKPLTFLGFPQKKRDKLHVENIVYKSAKRERTKSKLWRWYLYCTAPWVLHGADDCFNLHSQQQHFSALIKTKRGENFRRFPELTHIYKTTLHLNFCFYNLIHIYKKILKDYIFLFTPTAHLSWTRQWNSPNIEQLAQSQIFNWDITDLYIEIYSVMSNLIKTWHSAVGEKLVIWRYSRSIQIQSFSISRTIWPFINFTRNQILK